MFPPWTYIDALSTIIRELNTVVKGVTTRKWPTLETNKSLGTQKLISTKLSVNREKLKTLYIYTSDHKQVMISSNHNHFMVTSRPNAKKHKTGG